MTYSNLSTYSGGPKSLRRRGLRRKLADPVILGGGGGRRSGLRAPPKLVDSGESPQVVNPAGVAAAEYVERFLIGGGPDAY